MNRLSVNKVNYKVHKEHKVNKVHRNKNKEFFLGQKNKQKNQFSGPPISWDPYALVPEGGRANRPANQNQQGGGVGRPPGRRPSAWPPGGKNKRENEKSSQYWTRLDPSQGLQDLWHIGTSKRPRKYLSFWAHVFVKRKLRRVPGPAGGGAGEHPGKVGMVYRRLPRRFESWRRYPKSFASFKTKRDHNGRPKPLIRHQLLKHYFIKKLRPKRQWKEELLAKQRLKKFYGQLKKNELKLCMKRAKKKNLNLFTYIEKRLDVLVVRAQFALSIFQARFLIKNKYIKVNGITITHKNFLVPAGSIITSSYPKALENYLKSYYKHILAFSRLRRLYTKRNLAFRTKRFNFLDHNSESFQKYISDSTVKLRALLSNFHAAFGSVHHCCFFHPARRPFQNHLSARRVGGSVGSSAENFRNYPWVLKGPLLYKNTPPAPGLGRWAHMYIKYYLHILTHYKLIQKSPKSLWHLREKKHSFGLKYVKRYFKILNQILLFLNKKKSNFKFNVNFFKKNFKFRSKLGRFGGPKPAWNGRPNRRPQGRRRDPRRPGPSPTGHRNQIYSLIYHNPHNSKYFLHKLRTCRGDWKALISFKKHFTQREKKITSLNTGPYLLWRNYNEVFFLRDPIVPDIKLNSLLKRSKIYEQIRLGGGA